LNFVGTSDGVDHAGELGNSAVPGILDNTSVMLSDFGIENRSSKRFQSRQRAFLRRSLSSGKSPRHPPPE